MIDKDLVVFIQCPNAADWSARLAGTGLRAIEVAAPVAIKRCLTEEWTIALVVADLRLVDAELLERLQAPDAPPAIFLMSPDAGTAGLTAAPNVRNYFDIGIGRDELQEAIFAVLAVRAPAAVGDFVDRTSRLSAIGGEVERIARALNELADDARLVPAPVTAPYIRQMIRQRRDRESYFPAEIMADPAWDMLLDLTAAGLEAKLVSVSSLCIAAAVPATTALRWIRNLCDLGRFERHDDPDDLRRALISLSADSAARMMSYLSAVRAAPAG